VVSFLQESHKPDQVFVTFILKGWLQILLKLNKLFGSWSRAQNNVEVAAEVGTINTTTVISNKAINSLPSLTISK